MTPEKRAAWHSRYSMSLSVERYSFYRQLAGPTLRFSEHAPADAHGPEPFECGCTLNISNKPAGRPHEVQQEVYLRCPFPYQKMRAEFKLCAGWLTLFFDEIPPLVPGGRSGRDNPRVEKMREIFAESDNKIPAHAYFIFSERDHVRMEMTLPGYGLTDHFFADVRIGREADLSRILDGHSPSRVVDLRNLRADDVWVHASNYGREAMRFLPHDGEEAESWREIFGEALWISRLARPYGIDHFSPIGDVFARALFDDALVQAAYHQAERLARVAGGLRGTSLYGAQDDIDREIFARQDDDG
jgi:hypothetical protein